eukprot:TRINITY_DN19340_c0_g1_i1.p1 TRINITY_DN19340_c0_g1~~TRINITY_DN19340_c0_g1_i1.p1  ORF type:complete len:324 (+),score=51.74 TRINITY_DN19340_c0_g1_i1:244-1215(+)
MTQTLDFSPLSRYLPSDLQDQPQEIRLAYLADIIREHHVSHGSKDLYDAFTQFLLENYPPKHPELKTIDEKFFTPSFWNAVQDGSQKKLREIPLEASPGVWIFDMLTPEFCNKLIEEVDAFQQWCDANLLRIHRPNNVNHYGVVLDDFGFYDILQEWLKRFIKPMAAFLLPEFGGDSLDDHHGFVVEFEIGKESDTNFHVDRSEVTLNVCLGKVFEGGDIYFSGVRCSDHINGPANPDEKFEIPRQIGQALIYSGRHRNGSHPITSGERLSLTMWCRSSKFAQENSQKKGHPSWCPFEPRIPEKRVHVPRDPVHIVDGVVEQL